MTRARSALAAAMSVVAWIGLTAVAAPSKPTAEDFGALPFMSAPEISPSGDRIVARKQIGGGAQLAVVDYSSGKQLVSIINLGEARTLQWYRWAGNDVVLISVGLKATSSGTAVRATRLLSYNVVTKATRVLGDKGKGNDGDDLVYTDPAGKFILLSLQAAIDEYPSVMRIDLATGKATEIVRPHNYVWDWYADTAGVVRAGLGSDDSRWWVLYRPDGKSDFAKTIRRTYSNEAGQIDSFVIAPATNQGYAIASGQSGRYGVYRYDFATDTLGAAVYENSTVDIDDVELAPDGSVQSVSFTDDRARIVWFDPDLKEIQADIERSVPGLTVRIASMTANRSRMLVWTGSARNPGTYYLYDRGVGRMGKFAEPYEKMRGKSLSDMQSVAYKARDGLDIPAYLTLPAGRDAKKLPLVMLPHGGPFARDEWGYDIWAQFLASRGYVVLQPNFRGSTGYGKKFVEKGNGQWGRGMQDDVDDGVKWLVDRGMVDPKRVCIMGASFGGYAAEWAAVRNPEIYRCAISFAGVSDIGAQLSYDRKSFSAPRYFRDWRSRIQGTDGTTLDSISPAKRAADLKVPLLLAHGDADTNVPIAQSNKLFDALSKLGRPPEYYVYKGEGHGFAKPEDQIDFLKKVEAFLAKHNPS